MKLSVIIPVYKVEEYLDRCIKSVINQDIPDIEIILVDDGSPDNCPQLCDKWAEKDDRIVVIHKQNGGLSEARNVALDIAKGEYITFVDSDDYLNDGVYKHVFSIINKNPDIDFVEFSINCVGWHKVGINYSNYTYSKPCDYWLKTHAWNHSYVCNKIFKRKLFDRLRFPIGKIYEDLIILPDIIKQSSVIATSSFVGYNYCMNSNGISALPDSENLKKNIAAMRHVIEEMHVRWYSYREWNMFLNMLYRQVDIYRMSGEIVLNWPFVRFICWIHKHTKGRYKL